MKSVPQVSVIITTFNQPQSLTALLYCLLGQTGNISFEVLVCDDGSSLATFASVANTRRFDRLNLRYIWQPKRGYRAARSKNNGIRCARGEVIVLLDADILIKRDFLRRHVEVHAGSKNNMIVCNPRRWILLPPQNRHASARRHDINYNRLLILAEEDLDQLFAVLNANSVEVDRSSQRLWASSANSWMACIGYSLSVKRRQCLYFDERFQGWGPEDREFALRLCTQHGFVPVYKDDIEVFHLDRYSTGRPPGSYLPKAPQEIASLLANLLYLRDSYSSLDLSALLQITLAYQLNGKDEWCLGPSRDIYSAQARATLPAHLEEIGQWLYRRGIYRNSVVEDENYEMMCNEGGK